MLTINARITPNPLSVTPFVQFVDNLIPLIAALALTLFLAKKIVFPLTKKMYRTLKPLPPGPPVPKITVTFYPSSIDQKDLKTLESIHPQRFRGLGSLEILPDELLISIVRHLSPRQVLQISPYFKSLLHLDYSSREKCQKLCESLKKEIQASNFGIASSTLTQLHQLWGNDLYKLLDSLNFGLDDPHFEKYIQLSHQPNLPESARKQFLFSVVRVPFNKLIGTFIPNFYEILFEIKDLKFTKASLIKLLIELRTLKPFSPSAEIPAGLESIDCRTLLKWVDRLIGFLSPDAVLLVDRTLLGDREPAWIARQHRNFQTFEEILKDLHLTYFLAFYSFDCLNYPHHLDSLLPPLENPPRYDQVNGQDWRRFFKLDKARESFFAWIKTEKEKAQEQQRPPVLAEESSTTPYRDFNFLMQHPRTCKEVQELQAELYKFHFSKDQPIASIAESPGPT